MAAFAVGGLAITASLSVFTYLLGRAYLVSQQQGSAVHQADANAQLVQAVLRSSDADVSRLLSSLATPSGSQSLVWHSGRWYGSSAVDGPDTLPSGLRRVVVDRGRPARQLYLQSGSQVLAVGIPMTSGSAYFEVFSMSTLASTLSTLADSLAVASGLGFLVSLAVGAWATRLVLRPLRDIGQAAADISAGELRARLDVEGDRELAELATGFNSMVDILQDRLDKDARFASDVSHELRSPLTTLHSAVEVMQRRKPQLDQRSARALDLLSEEVIRFETLVEDLLEVSRYDAGAARLDLQPVDLASLTAAVLVEAGQSSEVAVAAASTVILADRRRLEQALRNVVGNAVSHAGGVTGASVTVDDCRSVISVEDRGPGVLAEEKEAIFERFARGRAAGRRSSGGGVGLGLAIVAEHVGLHGGKVRVEDVGRAGSRFVIELPTRWP